MLRFGWRERLADRRDEILFAKALAGSWCRCSLPGRAVLFRGGVFRFVEQSFGTAMPIFHTRRRFSHPWRSLWSSGADVLSPERKSATAKPTLARGRVSALPGTQKRAPDAIFDFPIPMGWIRSRSSTRRSEDRCGRSVWSLPQPISTSTSIFSLLVGIGGFALEPEVHGLSTRATKTPSQRITLKANE